MHPVNGCIFCTQKSYHVQGDDIMQKPPVLEIAAAYIRVSTDDQTELSPDSQLHVILDAAKADGYIIPKEYIFME